MSWRCGISCALSIAAVACDSSTESTSADGGLDASADANACLVVANTCASGCCQYNGYRVDLANECTFAARNTVFACQPEPCPKPNTALGCVQRPSADGGVDTFVTPSIWRDGVLGPDVTRCSEPTTNAVLDINQTCP